MQILLYLILVFIDESELEMCGPALVYIKNLFNLSESKVEWIISANIFSHCIVSIFVGNYADKYGKRKTTLYGFIILVIGSIVTIISDNYLMLIVGRIIQGIGMSGPAITLYAMMLEITSKNKKNQLKIIGYFNAVFAISLSITPTIGSYATIYLGWKGSFIIIFIFSIIGVLITKFLLNYEDKTNKNMTMNLREYLPILKSLKIMLCVVIGGFTIYIPYLSLMPLVFINEYNVSLRDYGLYMGAGALIWGIANILLGHVIKFFGKEKSIKGSLIIFAIGGIFLLILGLMGKTSVTPLMITIIYCFTCLGIIIPNNAFYMYSFDEMPEAKSRIGTIYNLVKFISATIAIELASHFYTHSFKSTGITLFIIISIVLIATLILLKIDGKKIYNL